MTSNSDFQTTLMLSCKYKYFGKFEMDSRVPKKTHHYYRLNNGHFRHYEASITCTASDCKPHIMKTISTTNREFYHEKITRLLQWKHRWHLVQKRVSKPQEKEGNRVNFKGHPKYESKYLNTFSYFQFSIIRLHIFLTMEMFMVSLMLKRWAPKRYVKIQNT